MGIKLIKISAVYFLIGILIGYYMSIVHDYSLTGVHVHVNLLGWTALTLAGLIYHLFPSAASSNLAKWHFWLHNIGLPIMMISLTLLIINQNPAFTPGVAVGASLTVLGIFLFVINIFQHVKE